MNKPNDKPAVADLEAALARGDDVAILPNGTASVRRREPSEPTPLTKRTDLGGTY